MRIVPAVITAATCLTFLLPVLTPADTVKIDDRTFTLPPGFTIERVVAPPLALRPITIDFDDRGRLYVADSSGSSARPDQQLKERPHRILRLEDTDHDGVFDRQTVFADKMMFPEGTMWLEGSLYVAAPPSIWKLTDTDDDGVADQRVEWFQGKTLTGCANDLHGPYAGPDGLIYWTKGAFAKQTYTLPNGKAFTTRAAHIFRARPDGSGVEPVMTGGMDNPVDVAFTPAGERIFTTTFLQNPAGGKRDGLIHAIYGGVYGKVHDVIDGHVRTGPDLMPVLSHLGPAAPSGLHRYEGTAFGPDYENNLFTACFNLRKVVRHVLTADGPTFKSRDEDFVVCDHVDFHPTDVIEDADGSLLIVDTGGWYKLCCPTSQLVKPDILGAIYRVRRTDAKKPEDPRGHKIRWNDASPGDLATLLDDARPAVRRRAIQTLAARAGATPSPKAANASAPPSASPAVGEGRGEGSSPAQTATLRALDRTLESGTPRARLSAVWAVTRLPSPDARATIRAALADKDETVLQAACHAASVWRDPFAMEELVGLLDHASPHVRRAAAEALGRIGRTESATPLFAALQNALEVKSPDPILHHALIYALIELGLPQSLDARLSKIVFDPAQAPALRRAALILLDQVNSPSLQPFSSPAAGDSLQMLGTLLLATDPPLRQTTAWVVGHRPEWGDALAISFREMLVRADHGPDPDALRRQLASLAAAKGIQTLLSDTVRGNYAPASRAIAMGAMADAALRIPPASWLPAVTPLLESADPKLVAAAVAAVRKLAPKPAPAAVVAALHRVAADPGNAPATRLDAIAALPAATSKEAADLPPLPDAAVTFLTGLLNAGTESALRLDAAETLGRSKLSRDQLLALTAYIEPAAPLELDRLMNAFTQPAADDEVGQKLLNALEKSKSLASIHPSTLKSRLARFGPDVQKKAQPLLARLAPDAAQQAARLDALQKSLPAGDVRRGQLVFNSAKAACATCHAIGYVGGRLGPDLTKIGAIRQERDLLESILYPSASFTQTYEPVIVETTDNDTLNGFLRSNTGDHVTLTTGPDQEARLSRNDVKSIRPGTTSLMPPGLDQQLSPQELSDLIAFLKAAK
jgi:putative membrane-bound dehydrogenase-like protein